MLSKIATLGILALFATAAFGQTASGSGSGSASNTSSERVFQLTGGETPQATQEIVNTVRSVAEVRQIVPGPTASSVAVQGTLEQIAMAAWVIGELDQPTKAANLAYQPPEANSVVRIFYLAHAGTPRQVQEIVNVVRSITEIPRITAYNSSHAVVLRSTQAQAALAEWVIEGLDIAPSEPPAAVETPVTFGHGEVARIFYLTHNQAPQQVQEIVNVIRALASIQRLTAYDGSNAISMRGTAAQAALATWLVGELDKPAPAAATVDSYQVPGATDGAVRVFYLPGVQNVDDLQQLVNQVRAAGPLPRIMSYISAKALALRGTAGQVALAEQAMQPYARP